ncbi:MAG: hypothetical protein FJ189_06785, partial [Gammaproteobacteria bacterium]|nr:hypothetical protein [Gammaproteobacteria bacterium]
FDHCIRVAFIDEGVRYLTAMSASASEREERVRGMIAALDLYEVREVIVGLESLQARGLDDADLRIAVTVVPEAMIAGLIAEHERIQIA